jgi:hypothetical protein
MHDLDSPSRIFEGLSNILVLKVWIRIENLRSGIAGGDEPGTGDAPNPPPPNLSRSPIGPTAGVLVKWSDSLQHPAGWAIHP